MFVGGGCTAKQSCAEGLHCTTVTLSDLHVSNKFYLLHSLAKSIALEGEALDSFYTYIYIYINIDVYVCCRCCVGGVHGQQTQGCWAYTPHL